MPFNARFNELDCLLAEWQWLWREVPFKQAQLSWFTRFPQWQAAIEDIDDDTVEKLASDMDALYDFAANALTINIAPRFYRAAPVTDTKLQGAAPQAPAPSGIRTRKWNQVSAFGRALLSSRQAETTPLPLIEWCAGKGHLSRQLLAQRFCNHATGLEIDPMLVATGASASQGENTDGNNSALQLRIQNVLEPSVSRFCTHDSHHIALHACGRLHVSMLQHCSENQVQVIDLVPCCYHLIDNTLYTPLSAHVRNSALALDDDALKLALQETVTAPGNARRNRERLQQWRLGFDSLQRELRNSHEYLPLPSMSVGNAGADFTTFCKHRAEEKQIALPQGVDYTRFEAIGRQRFARVSRYDLIRQLFRRPLELWLVYDRALMLEEHGYDVEVREFCARELTPRNLWIHARKQA